MYHIAYLDFSEVKFATNEEKVIKKTEVLFYFSFDRNISLLFISKQTIRLFPLFVCLYLIETNEINWTHIFCGNSSLYNL